MFGCLLDNGGVLSFVPLAGLYPADGCSYNVPSTEYII
jgi:hypothetical protein